MYNFKYKILYCERVTVILAATYTTVRNQFKNYCDKASDEEETVIITRKNDKHIVMISFEEWNRL